jgi:hypothetical protein
VTCGCRLSLSALRRGTGYLELGHGDADRFEHLTGNLDRGLELVCPAAQRRHGIVGRLDIAAEAFEHAKVFLELGFALRGGHPQLLDAPACVVQLGREREGSALELCCRFL